MNHASFYDAKIEIITSDVVDGKDLAWRIVRPLNAHKNKEISYKESMIPVMHTGFVNINDGTFFGYFDSSMVVDGKISADDQGPDPWTHYKRHLDIILDKSINADAFLIEHGYNQEILTQARKNIDFSWNKEINKNVEKYYWATRNCWHYMHAVEQEYVKLGGVLYFKHTKK